MEYRGGIGLIVPEPPTTDIHLTVEEKALIIAKLGVKNNDMEIDSNKKQDLIYEYQVLFQAKFGYESTDEKLGELTEEELNNAIAKLKWG